MKFEFDIDPEKYEYQVDVAHSMMFKFFSYLKCLKNQAEWFASQDTESVCKYLVWFCRENSDKDPEILNYELAFMAGPIYSHKIIDEKKMADFFIRRYSRYKGYIDSGLSIDDAVHKDFEDAQKYKPDSEFLKYQGRAFSEIDSDIMNMAYGFISTYAHLFTENIETFKAFIPKIFSPFDSDWRALFTDQSKMVVFKIDRGEATDTISYVPDEDEEENAIYVLSMPNLIANCLEWYKNIDEIFDDYIIDLDDEDDEDDD
jgi:hypothetical protein